jgi:hypothetical protein
MIWRKFVLKCSFFQRKDVYISNPIMKSSTRKKNQSNILPLTSSSGVLGIKKTLTIHLDLGFYLLFISAVV